jgi:4,4'-diaponeurosporenoate glycosyltransferase
VTVPGPTLGAALVAVGWLAGTVLLWRVRTPTERRDPAGTGSISVVIPARDEERNLPRLLASLRAQRAAPLEVIVVDDSSTDDTAAVARAAGATVLTAPVPDEGWLGKPWACHVGAQRATGDRLVFLDADTWLAPDALERLGAAHHHLVPTGLLSVQPFHEVRRPYEQMSALANVVPLLASGTCAPRPRLASVAFGPCLVTRATDLHAVGGFAAARRDTLEDVALARAYRAAGRPVRCLGGGATVRFRMYPDGWRSLVAGWTKNLAGGAARTPLVPTLGAVAWVCALVIVALAGVTQPGWPAGVAWVAVAGQLWWMLRRVGSFSLWTAVLFPLPLLGFILLFASSVGARAVRRQVTWRGRTIRLGPTAS